MKMTRYILTGALLLLNVGFLMAQTENNSLIKPFGIGLHIEQFKINDISDLSNAPANKIMLSISPMPSFRLEPEFGIRFGKNKTADLKNSSTFLGLGAFGMIQRSKVNIYGGLRFEYANILSESSGYITVATTITSKTTRITIGPAIGCEYYLGENFSFGGEVGLKYATLKTTQDPKQNGYVDKESNYFTTDTGLLIHFYF